MAAGRLPRPGTPNGPCGPVGPTDRFCQHQDCVLTRQMAQIRCQLCHTAIGFDRDFYQLDTGELAHADCLEDEELIALHRKEPET